MTSKDKGVTQSVVNFGSVLELYDTGTDCRPHYLTRELLRVTNSFRYILPRCRFILSHSLIPLPLIELMAGVEERKGKESETLT